MRSFSCIMLISSMSCPSTLAFCCREQGHVRSQTPHNLPSGPCGQGACTLDTHPDVQSQATQSHSTGHSSDSVIGSALPHSHQCESHAAMQFPHSSTATAQLDVSPAVVASAPKPSSRECRESGQTQANSTAAVAATATTSVPAAAAAAAASALAAAPAAAAATTMVRAAAAAPAAAPATVAAPGTGLRLPELTNAQAVQAQTSHCTYPGAAGTVADCAGTAPGTSPPSQGPDAAPPLGPGGTAITGLSLPACPHPRTWTWQVLGSGTRAHSLPSLAVPRGAEAGAPAASPDAAQAPEAPTARAAAPQVCLRAASTPTRLELLQSRMLHVRGECMHRDAAFRAAAAMPPGRASQDCLSRLSRAPLQLERDGSEGGRSGSSGAPGSMSSGILATWLQLSPAPSCRASPQHHGRRSQSSQPELALKSGNGKGEIAAGVCVGAGAAAAPSCSLRCIGQAGAAEGSAAGSDALATSPRWHALQPCSRSACSPGPSPATSPCSSPRQVVAPGMASGASPTVGSPGSDCAGSARVSGMAAVRSSAAALAPQFLRASYGDMLSQHGGSRTVAARARNESVEVSRVMSAGSRVLLQV